MNDTMARSRKYWPHSLFGRLTLILAVGLIVAHGLSYALIVYQQAQTTKGMMLYSLGKDVASAVAILERVPVAERPIWLERLERRNYRYQLGAVPKGPPLQLPLVDAVNGVLRKALSDNYNISTTGAPDARQRRLDIHLTLKDGTPLTIFLSPAPTALAAPVPWLIVVQFAVLSVFIWLALRQVTLPLAQLARAADAIDPQIISASLPEDGPLEVALAATAFNAMQVRLAEFMAERMQILAAVSHDLQTPITRMRLRADLMEDAPQREKFLGDLRTMQMLVEEGIAYARNARGITEVPCRVNLDALLASFVYEYIDAGQMVRLSGRSALSPLTRPHALRRILSNLVDNALKFGHEVEVAVRADAADAILIDVLDRGPGIPAAQLSAVLQPFYRLEQSRNRDTGGAGLGLAIAHQLAVALGGALQLSNREGGGLRVALTLPVEA